MRSLKSLCAIALGAVFLFSCANWSSTGKGAAAGAGAGGVLGGVIGSKKGSTAGGAVIGAAVGGAAGAAIGRYMDRQAKQLEEEVKNAEVERVGEGIKVTFESGILFGFDSYSLTPAAQENVQELARILNEYPDTYIQVEGHTDNRGSATYNQGLSERRASSVANYLKMQGVASDRITTTGHGFDKPVADNETDEGRAKNRRVEVAIWANEDLKQKAEEGELEQN
ncbi:OmpA family protein [Litoribacter ruber]|uniref:OmpA family protein n=1 Tax=Litoribacter ruber TaxID=702568 RepID=A0AAP2CIX5_9BACT|nr:MULTISPECIES: OmpA family protein [Litoribacter]MBS9524725.1 OmpA family protein [Litoribacter alkaliphilus]MBT0812745.1 OmpA family protein [Litoribacter ruber]